MKSRNRVEGPGAWMESTTKSFINNSPENSLRNEGSDRAWVDSLVGFSSGDDPLYQEFKQYIGPFHWTPLEIFSGTFSQLKVKPDDLTVVSWVLPQNERTKSDKREQTAYPSERWVRGTGLR